MAAWQLQFRQRLNCCLAACADCCLAAWQYCSSGKENKCGLMCLAALHAARLQKHLANKAAAFTNSSHFP
jgi:hypothetical protein